MLRISDLTAILEAPRSFKRQLGSVHILAARYIGPVISRRVHLAAPNYSYEKRQRELAKKRKAEDKRQRKLSGKPDEPDEPGEPQDGEAGAQPAAPADPQT